MIRDLAKFIQADTIKKINAAANATEKKIASVLALLNAHRTSAFNTTENHPPVTQKGVPSGTTLTVATDQCMVVCGSWEIAGTLDIYGDARFL